jgi:hypothetical protein
LCLCVCLFRLVLCLCVFLLPCCRVCLLGGTGLPLIRFPTIRRRLHPRCTRMGLYLLLRVDRWRTFLVLCLPWLFQKCRSDMHLQVSSNVQICILVRTDISVPPSRNGTEPCLPRLVWLSALCIFRLCHPIAHGTDCFCVQCVHSVCMGCTVRLLHQVGFLGCVVRVVAVYCLRTRSLL